MENTFHELHPDGDVILIFQNPDTAFAVWAEAPEYWPPPALKLLDGAGGDAPNGFSSLPNKKRKPKGRKGKEISHPQPLQSPPPPPDLLEPAEIPRAVESEAPGNQDAALATRGSGPRDEIAGPSRSAQGVHPAQRPTPTPPRSVSPAFSDEIVVPLVEPKEVGVRMRVSSSHLTVASPYFKRMFKGDWRESRTLSSDGSLVVYIEDWDSNIFLILMNIIHGHTRKVPRWVSLEVLAKFAVLVDYYECFEVAEVYTDIWINGLKKDLPQTYSRDLILWIWISWVFRQEGEFSAATGIALKQSQEPIQALGLPIPERVVERINQRRQQSINQIVTSLHGLQADFLSGLKGCSFECSSILLGALTKGMDERRLFSPPPGMPFLGLSFAGVVESFGKIRSPKWSPETGGYCKVHECSLKSFISPIMESLENSMKGLALHDL